MNVPTDRATRGPSARVTRPVLAAVPLAVGLALGASWWWVAPPTPTLAPLHLVLFVLAVATTELLPMRQPGGRPVATSAAVLAALALLGAAPHVVAGVAVLGYLLGRALERRLPSVWGLLARGGWAWALAGLVTVGSLLGLRWVGTTPYRGDVASLDLGAAALVTLAILVGIPAYQAATTARGRAEFLPRRMVEAVRRSWLPGTAIASTALLGGIVHDVLGGWTLPTMLIPLFAARIGLEHFADATRAYDQTIRAMSRLPEQLGAVDAEHGVRVGRLAHAVGLELGLEADLVTDLEHAAYLHELGRIRLDDPLEAVTRRELAAAGASIVQETGSLERVAAILAATGDPHRAPAGVAVPARVVAACCEVDRYRPEDEGHRQEMMVRLVRDIGDLDVVSALSRVLQRTPSAHA